MVISGISSVLVTLLITFKFVSSKRRPMIEKHNRHNSGISVPGFREPAASLPEWISSHTVGIFEISHSRCLLWWSRDRRLGSSVVDDIHPAIFHGRRSDYPPLSFVITAHLLRASRRLLGVLPRLYHDSAEHRQAGSVWSASKRRYRLPNIGGQKHVSNSNESSGTNGQHRIGRGQGEEGKVKWNCRI